MEVKTYTALRQNLAKVMDSVINNHEPVIVTRNNSDAVVMLSLEDYNSIIETHYLVNSPNNARRLLSSIDEVEALISKKK